MQRAAEALDGLTEPSQTEAPEPAGFATLRELLADRRPFADELSRKRAGRIVRKVMYSADFEKAVLDPQTPPTARLRRLCELQKLAQNSDLRPRDRDEASGEIDRAGMRVLWGARVVETVLESEAPPESRAAALLWLIAEGVLPAGACAKSALEPAKQLLQTEQAHEALKSAPQMRDQILDLLAAATPKPRAVEGPVF
jgi:hypothetical protein